MEVNIKNNKYNCVEKSIIELNYTSPSLINIIREESMGINIYYINHFYLEGNNKLRPFYFSINDVYGYFEKNNGKKYFNIDNTHNNKKILQKYMSLWDDIKDVIKHTGGNPSGDFVKDNMTFKFDTDDNIPLGKALKFNIVIFLKSIIEQDFDYYLQVYLKECKYKND